MTPAVTRQVGGEAWRVDAEFASALFPSEGEGLAGALAAGRVERVKGGNERETGRVTVGGRVYYVKEFYGPLGGRRARREWRAARQAFGAGLSTPRPVAAVWQGGAACVTLDAGPGRTLSDLVYETYFEAVESEPPGVSPVEPPYPGHRPPELVRLFRRRMMQPAKHAHASVGMAPEGSPCEAPSPREIAELVAELVIEMHGLGMRYRDLHPGNLLVVGRQASGYRLQATGTTNGNNRADTRSAPTTAKGDGQGPVRGTHGQDARATVRRAGDREGRPYESGAWRLVVLDLAAMETVRRGSAEAGRRAVVEHLVQLNHFFEPLATRAERYRVLKMLESRGLRVSATAGEIESATWAYRHGFYRGRDRRARGENKYFDRVRVGHVSGMAAADVSGELPRLAGAGLSRAVQIHEMVKQSRREMSGFGRLGERRVFVKRDTRRGWRLSGRPWPAAAEQMVRGSRQERAWRRANALLVRGVRTARPLVWLDVSHGPLGRESLMVSEALEGSWRPLDVAVAETSGAGHTRLVASVAREVRRMHDAGISNGDLKAQNILVQCVANRWQVAMVDMAGVRLHRGQVSRVRRMQNLMRLAFSWSGVGVSGQARGLSRTDRLRFLKTYLGAFVRQTITVASRRGEGREVIEGVRAWWRGIAFGVYEKGESSRR